MINYNTSDGFSGGDVQVLLPLAVELGPRATAVRGVVQPVAMVMSRDSSRLKDSTAVTGQYHSRNGSKRALVTFGSCGVLGENGVGVRSTVDVGGRLTITD